MIWSARSTDWTPPSLGSLSPPESAFGPIVLRRITFLFIATCISPCVKTCSPPGPQTSASCRIRETEMPLRLPEAAFVVLLSEQARAARPLVFRAQHLDRQFGRVGIGGNAVLIEIFGGFLDLDVAGERGDHRLHKALGLHLLLHLDHVAGEYHRRRDDGVPVAEDQRMDAL